MNVERTEEKSLEFLKEMISNIGGWPVVEGDRWSGDNFTWWKISIVAANMGFDFNSIITISKIILLNPLYLILHIERM